MFKASMGGKYLQDFMAVVPVGKDPVLELAKTLQTKSEFLMSNMQKGMSALK